MASLLLGVGAPPMPSQYVTASASLSFSKSHSITAASLSSFSKSHSIILPPSAASLSAAALPLIYCGRGDKKTARGKRFNHSFGNARPKNKNKGRGPPRVPAPPLPPRKDKYDDGEVIKIEIDESFSN